jgi:hypothetical protein
MSGLWSARGILNAMTPADGVVAIGVLVLSGVVAASSGLPSSSPGRALVSVGRVVVLTLPLERDAERTVSTRLGRVRLEVADGSVRVVESGCPQQLCVRMGKKSRAGELIACVPNALVVRLEGAADPDAPDAVSR